MQQVKLASYLGTQSKVFVLDEPTDGLHVKDIRHIISLFDSMVDQGNSVFLIEHNLDVLKAADYVIEIGPGGGLMGGEISCWVSKSVIQINIRVFHEGRWSIR